MKNIQNLFFPVKVCNEDLLVVDGADVDVGDWTTWPGETEDEGEEENGESSAEYEEGG